MTTTNVAVAAIVSGAGASPEVQFILERQGFTTPPRSATAPYALTLTNLAAGKYFLTATASGAATDVSFDIVSAPLAPPNDSWSQAINLAGVGVITLGTNTYATGEANEPNHANNSAGRSLWWRWQASASGPVTVTTLGSTFDTVLAVYTGTNLANLTLVAANNDAGSTNQSSQASFTAVQGTTYYLAADGAPNAVGVLASGTVQLQLLGTSSPAVSLVSPVNGTEISVLSPTTETNLLAVATISDATGISRVEYALDGSHGARVGTFLPPYQLPLTNLSVGDYLLTISAINTSGLIAEAQAGFSIRPLSPEISLVDSFSDAPPGFKLAITGLKGVNYELQYSTNLPAWNRLSLWTNFGGAQRFTDTNTAQSAGRFFRVVSQ